MRFSILHAPQWIGVGVLAVTLGAQPLSAQPPQSAVREASGIARLGNNLIIVGDAAHGLYWTHAIPSPVTTRINIDRAPFTRISPLAIDLESIAVNGDSVFVLSERLRGLIAGAHGVLSSEYPERMSEFGNRGVEGLDLYQDSVVVIWEGGFLEHEDMPLPLAARAELLISPVAPAMCVHALGVPEPCTSPGGLVTLHMPIPDDATQRFRVTDVVWTADGSGVILLMVSQSSTHGNVAYTYKWLQRFDLQGRPVGAPLNLCHGNILPTADLRSGLESNFEGLGWFDRGESVVMINDFDGGAASAVIVDVNPWPSTDPKTKCS